MGDYNPLDWLILFLGIFLSVLIVLGIDIALGESNIILKEEKDCYDYHNQVIQGIKCYEVTNCGYFTWRFDENCVRYKNGK